MDGSDCLTSIIINSSQGQMWEQSIAEQNLCNFSEEQQMALNWFDREIESNATLHKANSTGKLAIMQTTTRNQSHHQRTLYGEGISKRNGSEKTEVKKSSLPQIAFPVLGGSVRPMEHSESTRHLRGALASKLLNYETQSGRNFHSKFIQKMIEKETERIRATQMSQRNQAREQYPMKINQFLQETKGAFRNYKSLKKTNKTKRLQSNEIRYTLKRSSHQTQKRSTNKLSLRNLFKQTE